MAHKLTNSVTMDISPFAWSLARAVLNVSQNTTIVSLAYMLHVFGKIIDTCLENKYKCGLAIVHLSKIKSKLKLMKQ